MRIIFYFLFVGVFAAPSLAFVHFAVAPLSAESVMYTMVACLGAATLLSNLIRGPDKSKRDYVLTDRRLVLFNAEPADSMALVVACEADHETIKNVRVQGRSDYSAIRIDLDDRGQKRTILLLDQERPAEVAELIRRTLNIA